MANPLAEQFSEMLLERISSDKYPSGTQMDMLESIAPPHVLVAFVLHLIDRISDDQYPSVDMMRRVQRLIAGFGT